MSKATVTRSGLRYGDRTDAVKLHQYFSDSNLFGSDSSLPKIKMTSPHVTFDVNVAQKDDREQLFFSDDDAPRLNDSFSFESAKSFTTSNFHTESSSAEHDDSDTPLMTPSYSSINSTSTTTSTSTSSTNSNSTLSPRPLNHRNVPNNHSHSAELIVLQEDAEDDELDDVRSVISEDDDLLELSHVSSIEGDLLDILSLNESAYHNPKAVHFLGSAHKFSYSVSADIDPSELKIPESRGGGDGRETLQLQSLNNLVAVQPKNSATTLVDKAVECVATKLLDLSQNQQSVDPIEYGGDIPITPPVVERADSLQTLDIRKNKKMGLRKLPKVLMAKKRSLSSSSSSNRQLLNDVISGQKGTESARELFANPVLRKPFIRRYMVQSLSMNDKVRFDSIAVTASNGKIVMMDSKGFNKGCYEWSIEILKSDVEMQEIGVVSNKHIEKVSVTPQGVLKTDGFGARSAYGSELFSNELYYGSFNADGQKRCFRDLGNWYSVGWCVGDVITVRLDLNQHRIRYLLNGKAVRYCMSLEPNKTYYPFVSFSGNCKYYLH